MSIIRGGAEDTRLEAKDSPSKDRPSRGQGQGPKTQGKCSQKNFFVQTVSKKVLKKFVSSGRVT